MPLTQQEIKSRAYAFVSERLEFLFALYRQYTEPMTMAMEEKPK